MVTVRTARWLDIALLMGIWLASVAIARSTMFATAPEILGPAVAIDLTLTAVLVHAWLGLHRGGLPGWTTGPVVLVGVVLTAVLVPGQTGLVLVIAGLAELAVAGIALGRMRTLAGGWRRARAAGEAPMDALQEGLEAALESPLLARAVRLEVELLTLALTGPWRRARVPDGHAAFTHHQELSWLPLAWVLIGLSVVEGTVLHVLVAGAGHPVVAVGLSLLHVYGILWVMGDAHALRLRPTLVGPRDLVLRVGLRAHVRLPRAQIVAAEPIQDAAPSDLDLVGLGGPNLRLRLRTPVAVRGLLGLTRQGDALALYVDDRAGFIRALDLGDRGA